MNNYLDEYYFNPATGFKSGEKFYIFLKEHGLLKNYTRKQIINYVNSQSPKQKFNPYPKAKHQFKAVYPYQEFQCDLMFIEGKIFFTVIDVFSRKADVEYVENKRAETVLEAYKKCLKRSYRNKKPEKLYHDDGSEFKGVFRVFSTTSDIAVTEHKAGYVERFIWTFKLMLYRMIENKKEIHPLKEEKIVTRRSKDKSDRNLDRRRFMEFIPLALENYNNTWHSSIGMSPNDAFEDRNYVEVSRYMIDKGLFDLEAKPNFNEGETVRIKIKNDFNRIGDKRWSDETYQIEEKKGTFYKLKGINGIHHYSNLSKVPSQ